MAGSQLQSMLAKFREQQASAPQKVQAAKTNKPRPPRTKSKSEIKEEPTPPQVASSHWSEVIPDDASRRVPKATGLKIKRLLDALLEEEGSLNAEELTKRTGIDLVGDEGLFAALQANPKIEYRTGRFHYQAMHKVKTREELVVLLDKAPEGIPMTELEDAYKKVMQDIEALQEAGRVYVLQNSDTHESVLYPADPRLAQNVDLDIQTLWKDTQIPEDGEKLTQELHKCGLKPCARQKAPHVNRDKDADKKKEKVKKLRSVTNSHVAEIFQDQDITEPKNKKLKR